MSGTVYVYKFDTTETKHTYVGLLVKLIIIITPVEFTP